MINNISKYFYLAIIMLHTLGLSYGQAHINYTPIKYIIDEFNSYDSTFSIPSSQKIEVIFTQLTYLNSNLPNFENQNGLYVEKGYGANSGLLIKYKSKNIFLTVEPKIYFSNNFPIMVPTKEKIFSVLNDVPLNTLDKRNNNQIIKNLGFVINKSNLSLGYGNWNQWWGPGIHNSLVMTNNSEGFYNYFLELESYDKNSNFNYFIKYSVSEKMKNYLGLYYYLSSINYKIRYKNFEFGLSKNILSGGNMNIKWGLSDASKIIFTNENIRYWDQIIDLYLLYNIENIGLKAFVEIGQPNRSYNDKNPSDYSNQSRGSNIGIRKIGVFNNSNLIFGTEYARLVQGIYYNIIPTPNWYDNIKYNYNSYIGRRWAAHSGADSDDFLIYFGFMDKNNSIIYEMNYERHGVTYHFPPEVKFESRISFTHKYKNLFINFLYENEYYEHYGFVDSNDNIWNQTFEIGSIQRTNSLLFSIDYKLF